MVAAQYSNSSSPQYIRGLARSYDLADFADNNRSPINWKNKMEQQIDSKATIINQSFCRKMIIVFQVLTDHHDFHLQHDDGRTRTPDSCSSRSYHPTAIVGLNSHSGTHQCWTNYNVLCSHHPCLSNMQHFLVPR